MQISSFILAQLCRYMISSMPPNYNSLWLSWAYVFKKNVNKCTFVNIANCKGNWATNFSCLMLETHVCM